MPDSSQTKTEAASPRRLEEARKRGQVASSSEFATGLFLLFMLMLLSYTGPVMGSTLLRVFQMDVPAAMFQRELTMSDTVRCGRASAAFLIGTIAILITGGFAIGIGAFVVQLGFQLSPEAISLKASRMSPMSGVKKILSFRGMMRTGTAVTRFVTISGVVIAVCYVRWSSLLVGGSDLAAAVATAWDFCLFAAIMAALSMVVVGSIDFAFQRWQHGEELKMTLQDVKDESKEAEGDPQVKARIRKLQGEAVKLRTLNDVPTADVVITNPTHFAVAIKYERGTMAAPRVVAKGVDLMAQRIRRRATEAGVPIVERKSIARALYASTEVGSEIPSSLYKAVAKILAHIYGLST